MSVNEYEHHSRWEAASVTVTKLNVLCSSYSILSHLAFDSTQHGDLAYLDFYLCKMDTFRV